MYKRILFLIAFAIVLFVGYQHTIFAQSYGEFSSGRFSVGRGPASGTGTGGSFPAPPPYVTTGGAVSIGSYSATLTGHVEGYGAPVDVWFEYSNRNLIARGTDASPAAAASFSRQLTGLSPSTTYLYKACAESSGGISCGSVLSFRTKAAPTATKSSTVTTKPAEKSDVVVQEARPVTGQSVWNTVIRSAIFLIIIIIALALAIRIFHSGH